MVISIYRENERGRELVRRTSEEGYQVVQLIGIRMTSIAKDLIKVDYEEYKNSKVLVGDNGIGLVDVAVSFNTGGLNYKTVKVHCNSDDVFSSLVDIREGRLNFDDVADFGMFDCVAALKRVAESRIIYGCEFKELSLERGQSDDDWIFSVVVP